MSSDSNEEAYCKAEKVWSHREEDLHNEIKFNDEGPFVFQKTRWELEMEEQMERIIRYHEEKRLAENKIDCTNTTHFGENNEELITSQRTHARTQ